jgi:hypothetical protein
MKDLIAYVTSNERVCPKPMKWDEMWKLMGSLSRNIPDFPGLPLILNGWGISTDKQKRLRLIEHIKFGNQIGVLDKIDGFLRALSEDDWHHCPEKGLNAPSGCELMAEDWREFQDRLQQARVLYQELIGTTNFAGFDKNNLEELLSTYKGIYLANIDVHKKVLELEGRIISYETAMEDHELHREDYSEFTLKYCFDQYQKDREEMLLWKFLLCMGRDDLSDKPLMEGALRGDIDQFLNYVFEDE